MEEKYYLFSRALDGEMSEKERKKMESLLAADPASAEEWEGWQKLDAALLSAPAAEAPPYLAREIMDRVRAASKARKRLRRLGIGFAAFYVVSLLAVFGFLASHVGVLLTMLGWGMRLVFNAAIALQVFYLLGKSLSALVSPTIESALPILVASYVVMLFALVISKKRHLGRVFTKAGGN